tara:strand:+ start:13630 stop:13899 length:270 start_codon:yes stop_codon:yes gene_type:complete
MGIYGILLLLLIYFILNNCNVEYFTDYLQNKCESDGNNIINYQTINNELVKQPHTFTHRGYKGNKDMYSLDYNPEDCIPKGIPTSYYKK